MKQLSLEEIKEIEFNLLKKFDSFCKENGIKYFLSNGTLLGAVKYKGFIPWDDDIDVLVPRKDYDKLIATFEDSEFYRLFSNERDERFLFPFAKLCNTNTVKDESNINNGVELGLDIDIFPIDQWANNLHQAKHEVKRISRNRFCLNYAKVKRLHSTKKLKHFAQLVFMIFCKAIGTTLFLRRIVNISKKNRHKNSAYSGCKVWCVYGEKEIIPTEVFEGCVNVEFEGQIFPAPVGYDLYLRSLYGDYEKDPTKDKQKTHHTFSAFSKF